jgi:hypothetical protein
MIPVEWTLKDAISIVRKMDPIARRCNFSISLRGSVLLDGKSDNDLDLCFLSEEAPEQCSAQTL